MRWEDEVYLLICDPSMCFDEYSASPVEPSAFRATKNHLWSKDASRIQRCSWIKGTSQALGRRCSNVFKPQNQGAEGCEKKNKIVTSIALIAGTCVLTTRPCATEESQAHGQGSVAAMAWLCHSAGVNARDQSKSHHLSAN